MGDKNCKYNKYSYETKEKLIKEYLKGEMGYRKLSRKFGVTQSAAKNWITKYNKGGYEELKKDNRGKGSTGRPKSIKMKDYGLMSDKEKVKYLEMENDALKKLKGIRKDKQK